MLPVTVARSSSGGTAIRYVLRVLLTTTRHLHLSQKVPSQLLSNIALHVLPIMGRVMHFNIRAESDVYDCPVDNCKRDAIKLQALLLECVNYECSGVLLYSMWMWMLL